MSSKARRPRPQCVCGSSDQSLVFSYNSAPPGETRFRFASGGYSREVWRCERCGHFVSVHDMDAGELYTGEYVSATYGDDGLRRAFERIVSLDPSRSDNVGRVQRIHDFTLRHLSSPTREGRAPRVLDVGSGLCVFLHRMKEYGWECTALDPDGRAVEHAREVLGIDAAKGDFMAVEGLGRFDLVTFNKVLEHVTDPVAMVARSTAFLQQGGFVYVELPDGEMAVAEGPGREEFYIDHHHVFSAASLAILAARARFSVQKIGRLREPSTKCTLYGFLSAG